MDEMLFCQSCGMPIVSEEAKGTDKDGSKTDRYCIYCYKDGEFQATYDDIVGYCLDHPENWGEQMSREDAEKKIRAYVSSLGRWRDA